jgi:hypothetical protein
MACTGADTADGCEQIDGRYYTSLLVNGGFESGIAPWVEDRPVQRNAMNDLIEYPIIYPAAGEPAPVAAYAGTYLAWLGGLNEEMGMGNDETMAVSQVFSVPPNAVQVSVSFQHLISTDDVPSPYDLTSVDLLNEAGSATVVPIVLLSNVDETIGWELYEQTLSDVNALAGQTLQINFFNDADDSLITNFYFDEVSVTAACCGEPCETD